MPPRLTTPVRLVLAHLRASGPDHGSAIAAATGLGAGTVYPILHRLAAAGWLTTTAETGPHPSRPARRLYSLTTAAPTS